MATSFAQAFNATITQLQGQISHLTNQIATNDARFAADLDAANRGPEELHAVARTDLESEREAHEATRRQLADLQVRLNLANDEVNRGKAKYGSHWLDPPVERQSWIQWFQKEGYSMEAMPEAYRRSCVENNIHRRSKSDHALRHVCREDAPQWELAPRHDPEENFDMGQHFPFNRLINEFPVIARTIAIMTMKKGKTIHCIARLDTTEQYPPAEGGIDGISNLPVRFWWGPGKEVNINSAPRVGRTLAPIHVCREWAEIFGTAFFSQNKFSFASFGELHIFTRRILRKSCVERLVNVELWWLGSRNAFPINYNPETEEHYDRRTWPLAALTWMKRLKSLEIYVDESSKMVKRRANEPERIQKPLMEATGGQDNNRQLRDLRKLQGTDYVYQLRGMHRIRVYDSAEGEKRKAVRDKSFVADMRAQVTKGKNRKRGNASKLRNLKPIFRLPEGAAFVRTPQVDWIFRSYFDNRLEWDPTLAANPQNGGGGEGGDGDDGDDRGNGGNDVDDHQDGDDSSDSGSDSDGSDGDLFVRQPISGGAAAQPIRPFQGRRAMGRDTDGNPTLGFGNSQLSESSAVQVPGRGARGTRIGAFIIDDSDDDDELIVDEERSAPRLWGSHIDLTSTPDEPLDESSAVGGQSVQDQPAQVKDEDEDMDLDDAPAPSPNQDTDPAASALHDPQLRSVHGDDADEVVPKPDEDSDMLDIYDATPAPSGSDAMVEMPHGYQSRAPNGQGPVGYDLPPAAPHLPNPNAALNAIQGTSQEEAIFIDDDEEEAVQVLRAGFAGVPAESDSVKIEDDYGDDADMFPGVQEAIAMSLREREAVPDDMLPEVQEAIAMSLRDLDVVPDDDLPTLEDVLALSRRERSISAGTSARGTPAGVMVGESNPASSSATQAGPNAMRNAARMPRDLTPIPSSRQETPDPFATPSSSHVAADEEVFNGLSFPDMRSPSPEPDTDGAETPRASNFRRGSASSSNDGATVWSFASSSAFTRSRDEDSSTPTSANIDQLASSSRRSSASSRGGSAAVTRGLDDLNLMGRHYDGAGDSPPPKRRRLSGDAERIQRATQAQGAWLKTLPKWTKRDLNAEELGLP